MPPVIPGLPALVPGSTAFPADAVALALDPSVVVDAQAPVRAAGSFVLVLVFGGAILSLSEEFVTESVESSMERPLVSTLYGVLALGTVVFLGFYAVSQVGTVDASGAAVDVAVVALGVVITALVSLGFAVVGARLTEFVGDRRLWPGLVAGAAVSAVPWLVPSFVLALLVWVVVAGTGIGGPARNWLHASQSVETRSQSE